MGPYICILCDDRPLLPSYNRLRAHLRIIHGVTDKEFDFNRDEPRFRHPTQFQFDVRPNTFRGHQQVYGAANPPTFLAGELMNAIGNAISGAIQDGIKRGVEEALRANHNNPSNVRVQRSVAVRNRQLAITVGNANVASILPTDEQETRAIGENEIETSETHGSSPKIAESSENPADGDANQNTENNSDDNSGPIESNFNLVPGSSRANYIVPNPVPQNIVVEKGVSVFVSNGEPKTIELHGKSTKGGSALDTSKTEEPQGEQTLVNKAAESPKILILSNLLVKDASAEVSTPPNVMEAEPAIIHEAVEGPAADSQSNATIKDKPIPDKNGEMPVIDAASSESDLVKSDDNFCGTADKTSESSDPLCESTDANALGAQTAANQGNQSNSAVDDSTSAIFSGSEAAVSGFADSSCEIIENSCEFLDGNIGGTQMLADQRKQLESAGINTTTAAVSSGETLVTVQTRPLSPESISENVDSTVSLDVTTVSSDNSSILTDVHENSVDVSNEIRVPTAASTPVTSDALNAARNMVRDVAVNIPSMKLSNDDDQSHKRNRDDIENMPPLKRYTPKKKESDNKL